MNILEVEGLHARYGDSEVLTDISFAVPQGDFVALAGPNGSGKTTLLKCILGLVPHARGAVRLFGDNAARFDQWQRIGYLPQSSNPNHRGFPATAREIVASGRLALKSFPKRLGAADHAAVDRALQTVDILPLAQRRIDALSGGQRQRVFLARALVADPEILFMDEPTVALDPATRELFYQLLARINGEEGRTIVIVTHDSGTIGDYAKTLLYLDRTLVFFGDFKGFCKSSEMTAYFGHAAQHLICRQHTHEEPRDIPPRVLPAPGSGPTTGPEEEEA